MAKRKNGKAGSIFYDKSKDCWHGRLCIGVQDNGSFKQKNFMGKSKAEVERKIEAYEKELALREGLIDSEDTIDDYIRRENEFMYQTNQIRASTFRRREDTRMALSKFRLSKIPIAFVTRRDIEMFTREVPRLYSNSMIQKMWQLLYKIFSKAVWDRIIEKNPIDPASGIVCPKSDKEDKKVMPLSTEEQKKLQLLLCESMSSYGSQKNVHKNNYAPQFLLSCFTGMRIGEVNALALDDIDFENRRIYVRYTVARGEDYKAYIGPPKTKTGNRIVIMDDNTYKLLRYYMENIYPLKSQPLVIKAADGRNRTLLFSAYKKNTGQYDIVTSSQCNDQFKRICKKHGIVSENLCVHALRHTYATRCIESGISPYELQYRLGHADIHVTMDTYCNLSLEKQEQSLHQVTSYLEKQDLGLDFHSPEEENESPTT